MLLSILNIFFPFRPHRLFPIQHHQYTPYEYIIPCAIITSLHLLSSHSSNSKKKISLNNNKTILNAQMFT